MPFALVLVGLILIITGSRDTHVQFGQMLVKDFTGPNNFTYWVVSIGIVGALGYNETLRPFSRMFLFLIIVGMIIRNGGVFDKANAALKAGPTQTNPKGAAPGSNSFLSGLINLPGLPSLPTLT